MIRVVFHNAPQGTVAMRLPAVPRVGEWVFLPGAPADAERSGWQVSSVTWDLTEVTVDPRTETALGGLVDVYLHVPSLSSTLERSSGGLLG